jgi:septal ring factor EnvC (AmiA/AmiB activator)
MRTGSRVFVLALLLVLGTGSARSSECSAAEPSDSEQELQRIKREMQMKKKELTRANRKERSVLVELDKIDRDIQADSGELLLQQKRLRDAEASLQEIEKSNREINRELAGLKQIYGLRLRALYKLQRSGSAPLLAIDDPGNAGKQVKYLGMIADRDRKIIHEYGSALDRLALRQTEIAAKQREILESKRIVEAKKTGLETKRRQKAGILTSVRREKGLYEQTLHELEASSTSLWAMIRKDESERRSLDEAHASAPGRGERSVKEKGRLPWPLEGQVLTRFGMQRHPQFGTMVFRRGIEIEAREGQAVRAVSDGVVAYADWYKGYGKLAILDHGNGFYTLYGNLSRIDLNKGDRVTKGQVLGLAGETGSLKGAKLYFEIRQNGEAQDPLGRLAKR